MPSPTTHFAPAAARPIAFAMVDAAGTVKGTTSTMERDGDEDGVAFDVGDGLGGESTSRACEPADAETRHGLIGASFVDWGRVDGMGSVCEARRTAYWRSQRRRRISRVGAVDMPERRTWDVLRERREGWLIPVR